MSDGSVIVEISPDAWLVDIVVEPTVVIDILAEIGPVHVDVVTGEDGAPGPIGPAGPAGATGATGSANMSGMVAGQIPIAATATSVTASANLSGDVTSNATLVTTLATVNANVGTFQGLTVNAKGLVTAAANQSYLTTVTASTTYAPINAPVFTGDARAVTPATADNDTSIATTAYVQAQGYATSASVSTADNLRVLKAGDTMTGNLTVTNSIQSTGSNATLLFEDRGNPGSQWVWYSSGGRARLFNGADQVTVGTAGDIYAQLLYAANSGLFSYRSGTHQFASANGVTQFAVFDVTSTRNVSGTWATISSRELKQDIEPYTRGLDAIVALNPVQFRYAAGTPFAAEDQPSRQLFGLIAEEVAPHVPEIVGTTTGTVAGKEDVEINTLENGNLIFALINSCKELAARLEALEARLG